MTKTLGNHQSIAGLHTIGNTAQINVDHGVPITDFIVVNKTTNTDTGIVKHIIKPASLSHSFVDDSLKGLVVADI